MTVQPASSNGKKDKTTSSVVDNQLSILVSKVFE